MNFPFVSTLCLALTTLFLARVTHAAPAVILLIGDGMDEQQLTIARNYLHGASGRLAVDSLPVRSSVQVLTVSDKDPKRSIYVADSANSATAMATGNVTSRGRIATSAGTDRDLETIVTLANRSGLRTGLVTTSSITDATPASFATHISHRSCEDPTRMQSYEVAGDFVVDCSRDLESHGGPGSIAEQLARSPLDLILGGGRGHFEAAIDSQESPLAIAARNGFDVFSSPAELVAGEGVNRRIGLFTERHLPVRWRGEQGRIAEKPQPSLLNYAYRYFGSVKQPAAFQCEDNPDYGDTPSLKAMTDAALDQLHNDRGFFLMVESASIDKRSHQRDPCGQIGEVAQLMEALQSALAYAEKNPETLVLVTADHGQAAQLVPDESIFAAYGVPIFTPGNIARLQTPEGSIMAINYATNQFDVEEHTGVQVPLFANDVAAGKIPPLLFQHEIFGLMRDHLGI